MIIAGYILVVIGSIACLLGEIRMLAIAYKRGVGWLLGCLLLAPLCWFVLLTVDFKPTSRPFILAFLGAIAVVGGCLMAGIEY